MKFGICLPNFGKNASVRSIIECVNLAEELDYSSIFVTDHIIVPKKFADMFGNVYEPFCTLSYIACMTKKLILGTSIIVVPIRNPVYVAKLVATLDRLSDGRFVLGVGAGWLEEEFSYLGCNFKDRGKILDEAIMLMRALWKDQEVSFKGRFFRFKDAIFFPKTSTIRGPQIWIGGNSYKAVKRAARLGDAWHPVGIDHDDFERKSTILKKYSRGRQVELTMRQTVIFSRSRKTYLSPTGEKRRYLVGTVDDIINDIERYEDIGLSQLICWFGDIKDEKLKEQIKIFAKEVMQSFI